VQNNSNSQNLQNAFALNAAGQPKTAMDILKENSAEKGTIRILTWNIDGLDEHHGDVQSRTIDVVEQIVDLAL
tara:strand:- start:197 stop:415 length:219 start_codon:yes stop_codon:yes gene_type:complete